MHVLHLAFRRVLANWYVAKELEAFFHLLAWLGHTSLFEAELQAAKAAGEMHATRVITYCETRPLSLHLAIARFLALWPEIKKFLSGADAATVKAAIQAAEEEQQLMPNPIQIRDSETPKTLRCRRL
jgi:hypothetical protein